LKLPGSAVVVYLCSAFWYQQCIRKLTWSAEYVIHVTQAEQAAQDAAAAELQQRLGAAEGRLASVFDEAEAEHRRQTEVLQQRLTDAETQLASSSDEAQVFWLSAFLHPRVLFMAVLGA
jgi:hypothetical protein